MTIEDTAGAAADRVVRVPSNLMAILRQSYDTRQKALDWLLAFGVAVVCWYAFTNGVFWPARLQPRDPEQGRPDPPVPNTDVYDGAFTGVRQIDILRYNLPPSRASRYGQGPRLTRPPYNPGIPPTYTE